MEARRAGFSRRKGWFARSFMRLVPQRSRDGALAYHKRIMDRDADRYIETVTMRETGEVIHHCDEPLSEHQGHGAAKQKDLQLKLGSPITPGGAAVASVIGPPAPLSSNVADGAGGAIDSATEGARSCGTATATEISHEPRIAPASSAVCRRGWRRRSRPAGRCGDRSRRSGGRSTGTPSSCSATSASTTPNCAISRRGSARWRSAGQRRPAAGGGSSTRRSATSPTWTRTGGCANATTGAGSTASATGCGTPMRPTCRCRWCSACCMRWRCRRRAPWAAARPNSPICAPPMTPCRRR